MTRIIGIKNMRIMKELFEVMQKDILSEEFTKREYIVYGIVAPLALIAVCVLAEFINALTL